MSHLLTLNYSKNSLLYLKFCYILLPSSFKSLWYLCSSKTPVGTWRDHEICQRSMKLSFQSPHSLRSIYPNFQRKSRGTFTQISSAHSDDLRATQISSQNLAVGYQTFQSNTFMGTFWCHTGQLHNLMGDERNHHPSRENLMIGIKAKKMVLLFYLLSLTG